MLRAKSRVPIIECYGRAARTQMQCAAVLSAMSVAIVAAIVAGACTANAAEGEQAPAMAYRSGAEDNRTERAAGQAQSQRRASPIMTGSLPDARPQALVVKPMPANAQAKPAPAPAKALHGPSVLSGAARPAVPRAAPGKANAERIRRSAFDSEKGQ